MTALIIDGKQIAQKLRAEWKLRAGRLNALGIAPGLAAVMVGDNPASKIYVRNKVKACGETGIHSEEHLLAADSTPAAVLALIDRLNADASIHGILVQLPLPAQLAPHAVLERIAPEAVIDVGITRTPEGKLVGDVDYGAALQRAGWITPVPGGVGPMTIAILLANAILSAEQHAARQGIAL